jgi:uncharacterized protein YvpB
MIRSLCLILLLCLNQSFAQNELGIVKDINEFNNIKSQSIYCEVNHIPQYSNLCVGASAQMVLAYYGENIDQKDIKRHADGINYKDNDKRLYKAIFFIKLIKALKDFGIQWEEESYPMYSGDQGLDFIINEIRNKRPVLIDTTLYRGHTVVVNGYCENKKLFIITDPNIKSPGIRIISYQNLRRIWNSGGRDRCLVKT